MIIGPVSVFLLVTNNSSRGETHMAVMRPIGARGRQRPHDLNGKLLMLVKIEIRE